MSLFLRLFLILMFQSRGRKAGALDSTVVHSRVMPNDLDLNRHVNNGRVFTFADLGRVDWFVRTGLMRAALKHGWMPIIGDATGRFIKQLTLFERFSVESRMLGWGEKWAFMEHRILNRHNQLAGIVVIRGTFWSRKDGSVPPRRLIEAAGLEADESPELPDWVQTWAQSLEQLSAAARR